MVPSAAFTVLVYPVAPSGFGHQYLLLRRIPSRGGFWQGVSGAVEPDEALDEAAIRKLGEETRLLPIGLVPVHFHYTLPSPRRRSADAPPIPPVTEHVYLALLSAKKDPVIDPAEHDAWDWFTYEDALGWLRWPENREGLRRCQNLMDQARPHQSAR